MSGRTWLLVILTVGASLAAWWILVGEPGGETNPENTGLRDPTTTELPGESEQTFTLRTVLDPGSPTAFTDHTILDRRILIRDGRLAYRRDAG